MEVLKPIDLFLHVILYRPTGANQITVAISIVNTGYGWPIFVFANPIEWESCLGTQIGVVSFIGYNHVLGLGSILLNDWRHNYKQLIQNQRQSCEIFVVQKPYQLHQGEAHRNIHTTQPVFGELHFLLGKLATIK